MSKKKTKQPASDKVQVTVLDPRRELPSQVRYMSADRLAGIIELAQNGDTRELFALYRDVITNDNQVRSEFMKRKIAVLGDPVSVVPFQKKEQDDVDASAFCSDVLDNPTFADAQSWLMNATLYPVAVVEKVFEARPDGGFALKEAIRKHLEEQGIPWSAEGGDDFFRSTEVNVALSLLQVVDNPRQDVPLIAVLRSPVYGFTGDQLAMIRAGRTGDFYYGHPRKELYGNSGGNQPAGASLP